MLPIAMTTRDDYSSPAAPIIPIRALLLDDNRFDQRRIERMARESSLMITIDVAATLSDLVSLIDIHDYDIAFLDYRLPIGSGQDALNCLRAHHSNADCATIMVAGDEQLDNSAQIMRDACDSFISKDQLSPDLLRTSITKILSDRAMIDRTGVPQTPDPTTRQDTPLTAGIEDIIRDIRHLKAVYAAHSQSLKSTLSKLEMQSIRIWSDLRNQNEQVTEQETKFNLLAKHPVKTERAN